MGLSTALGDNSETHRAAVDAVLRLLSERGFENEPFAYRRGEKIRVTSHHGNPLAVPAVNLEVHGSKLSLSNHVMAPASKPVADEKEMVVCVSLLQPYIPLFLFLTNAEAAERWHPAGEKFFYATDEDRPDSDGVLKILTVGRRV